MNSNVISDGSEAVKKGVLRNFAKFIGKHLCQSLFFDSYRPQTCNFIKKETQAQVLSCECEIYKNTFFTEHFWMTASYSYCSYSGYYCHGFALLDVFFQSYLLYSGILFIWEILILLLAQFPLTLLQVKRRCPFSSHSL